MNPWWGIKKVWNQSNKIQRHLPIQILGIILTCVGIMLLINPTNLLVKISFGLIIIGTFMIVMTAGNYIPKQTSDSKIKGNMIPIYKLIIQLKLKGNAVFIPISKKLNEERIFISPNEKGNIRIPDIKNDKVILYDKNGEILGIALPPSGLSLLDEIDKEKDFDKNNLKHIEMNLKKFVGIDLIKSVSLMKTIVGYKLEIILNNPEFCFKNQRLCRQYPCPTCSAVLTAISRSTVSTKKRLWIKNIQRRGNSVVYYLNFIDQNTGNEGEYVDN
jgi:hypothetical protein